MNETTTEFFPPSKSAEGHNAYYVDGCDAVGHRPPYAVCVFKIAEWQAGRLGEAGNCKTCKAQMSLNACPAQAMMAEEALAGRALYYVNRKTLLKQNALRDESSTARLSNMLASGEKPGRVAPPIRISTPVAPREPSFFDATAGGYADAINAAIREIPVTPVTASIATVIPTVTVRAGMSMVEIARAALANAPSL